jgi:hypothetical protein
MDNFSRVPLKSVNFHYKSAHQVRPVHPSVLHLFPLRRLPRFQLLSWLPAACLEASMAKIWKHQLLWLHNFEVEFHPNCGYSDIKTLASMLQGALPCVAKKTLQWPTQWTHLLSTHDTLPGWSPVTAVEWRVSYFGDWSHGWSRLQQTKRCAFLGEGETRSMLNVIGSEFGQNFFLEGTKAWEKGRSLPFRDFESSLIHGLGELINCANCRLGLLKKPGRQKKWFVGYVGWRGWPIAGVSCDVGTEIQSNWQQLTIYAGCGKVQQAWVCLLQLRSVAHIGMSIADIFPCGTTIIFLVFGKHLSLGWSYSLLFTIILYHLSPFIHFSFWSLESTVSKGSVYNRHPRQGTPLLPALGQAGTQISSGLGLLAPLASALIYDQKDFSVCHQMFCHWTLEFPFKPFNLEIPFPSFGTLEHAPSLIYYRMITFQFSTSAAVFPSEHFYSTKMTSAIPTAQYKTRVTVTSSGQIYCHHSSKKLLLMVFLTLLSCHQFTSKWTWTGSVSFHQPSPKCLTNSKMMTNDLPWGNRSL